MNEITCLICHDDVRVPVQFTCFGCPICNIRVCMICARNFFELNKAPRKRKSRLKCPLCDTIVNPQNLSDDGSCYKKDDDYMSRDSRTDYLCFHSEEGCKFTGTQQQLNNHIQTTCQYRTTLCPCGSLYRVCDAREHFSSCACYRLCPDCNTYVPYADFNSHLSENHSKMICLHKGCHKIMAHDSIDIHTKKCEYRTIKCSICPLMTSRAHLIEHSRQHIETEQGYISRFMKDKDLCMERFEIAKQTYNKLMLEELEDIHTKKCECRTIKCSICSLTTTRADLIQHSRQHIEIEQGYISRFMDDIDLRMKKFEIAKQTYNDLRLEKTDI